MSSKIDTLGKLKESGWVSRSVKDEMRHNLLRMMKNGTPLFPGIVGYEKSVIPQIQHAILSRHDMILLGLRGQAKTRMLRMLVQFLDEEIPVIAGSEVNDDPYHPVSKYGRSLVEKEGDNIPVSWLKREDRYGEKLATPDTSVADLIGDLDPIKAASQKLSLSDEEVINFGLLPRANRGIFVINELPDLQPRIQVALLNIMQERDIQVRGFKVRIPLDLSIAFSANPEDYTNRGNIITPLKDRIDSQIITHYPKSIDSAIKITQQEAWIERESGVELFVPPLFREILEEIAFEARNSEYVDQKSGVSARLTITAMEQAVSAAERRAVINKEPKAVLRITDLYNTVPAITGKMELVYEGEQEGAINVARHMVGKAISKVFKRIFPDPQKRSGDEEQPYKELLNWFAAGNSVELADLSGEKEYGKSLEGVPGLKNLVKKYATKDEKEYYPVMDLVLEALHQHSMLGKADLDETREYSDMIGSMLGGLDDPEVDDPDLL